MSLKDRLDKEKYYIRACRECDGIQYSMIYAGKYYCTAQETCRHQLKSDYRIPYCNLRNRKK